MGLKRRSNRDTIIMNTAKSPSVTIDFLKNHPDLITTCAQWSFDTWSHHVPDRSLDDFIASRKEYAWYDDQLPLAMVLR